MKKLHLKEIKLHARYGLNNWLEHYKDGVYILHSEMDSIRIGYKDSDKKEIFVIDPAGGPFIAVGEILDEVGKEVKSIEFIQDKGYAITFKD